MQDRIDDLVTNAHVSLENEDSVKVITNNDFITNSMDSVVSIVKNIVNKYDDDVDAVEDVIRSLRSYQKEKAGDSNEPLLQDDNRQFTVFPIKYYDIWNSYKEQQAMFWKAEEIDFSADKRDYETLNDGEKTFVKYILAFFAASDGIVNFNLAERFLSEITNMEALINYQFQMMMENIHGEIYSQMLDNIIADSKEEAKKRNYKEKFTLKNQQYDENKDYYLILEDQDESVEKIYEKIAYKISLAITNDFGF